MMLFRKPLPGQVSVWFAWYPVELQDGTVVWLEHVYREYTLTIGGWTKYTYSSLK